MNTISFVRHFKKLDLTQETIYEPSFKLSEDDRNIFESDSLKNKMSEVRMFLNEYLNQIYRRVRRHGRLDILYDDSKSIEGCKQGLRLVWGHLYEKHLVRHDKASSGDLRNLFGVLYLMRYYFPVFWGWYQRWMCSHGHTDEYFYGNVEVFNRVCAWLVRND